MAAKNMEGTSRAEMTRASILAAARALFVEHGYGGTSMAKIAAKASVNHSLLFHHFENKQNLWLAVKQTIIKEGKNVLVILPDINLPLGEFLKELMTRAVDFFRKNPDIVRMISWQRLEHDTQDIIGLSPSEETLSWLNACKNFQARGEIDPSLKPEFVMSFVLSVVSSTALDPNIYTQKSEDREAYIDFCVGIILKALDKK